MTIQSSELKSDMSDEDEPQEEYSHFCLCCYMVRSNNIFGLFLADK